MTTAAEVFDPDLLRTLRAAPWKTIERRFLFILAASIGLHLALASYLAAQPMPVELSMDDVDRGFHPAPLPPLHRIPKFANPAPVGTSVGPAVPKPVSPAPTVDRVKIARLGMLGVINDSPNGAFHGLIDDASPGLGEALNGARANQNVATSDPTARGARTGDAVTVERLGTEGVKRVNLGTRVESRPAQPLDGPIVVEKTKDIDPRLLQQFIAARRAAVQGCYERALLHNPGLQGGRVVLRLAVGAGGRVNDLDIEEDTLGSEAVTACMSTLVKRWVFPVAPKEELPVSVPFIFARAN